MNPDSYKKIGQKLTKLEYQPGFAVTLKYKKTKTTASCDEEFATPALTSEFKVKKVGKIQCGFKDGKPQLIFSPKLEKLDAKLDFNAIDNSFLFEYAKKVKPINSLVTIKYDSAKNEPSVLIQPKFKLNKINFDANLLFKKPVENCPPVIFQAHAAYKKLFLCSCFNEEEKEYRAAAFAKLFKGIHAGALLHFDPLAEKQMKAVDVFAKYSFKKGKIAAITTLLGEKPVVMVNAKAKVGKKAKIGINTVYGETITGDFGVKADLKKFKLNLIVNAKKESDEISEGLIAQTAFKVKKVGKAKVGVAIPSIQEAQKAHLFVNLKIKD